MTLGNKIQELRKKQSLSQEAFAEIMGVTRQSVSKWELDQSYPAIDKLVEMADFFNISLDELLRNEATPTGTATNTAPDGKDIGTDVIQNNSNGKGHTWYFLWWIIIVIATMILFGMKAYMIGFILSQILVWTTVSLKIYSYIKRKANSGGWI